MERARDAPGGVLLHGNGGEQERDDGGCDGRAAPELAPYIRRDRDALIGQGDRGADRADEDAAEEQARRGGARVGSAAGVDRGAQCRDGGQQAGERDER